MTKYLGYILPFICFIGGYYALSRLVVVKVVEAPRLVGSSLEHAVIACSENKLLLHIMSFHEDRDMVPGTVIQQVPVPGTAVKQGQQVMVAVSQLPQKIKTPLLNGLARDEAVKEAKRQEIIVKEYTITDTAYPHGMVIAQAPGADTLLDDQEVVIYVNSDSLPDVRVVPDFTGFAVEEVTQWCSDNGHECDMITDQEYSRKKTGAPFVRAQMPLAGSFVDTTKKIIFQFVV